MTGPIYTEILFSNTKYIGLNFGDGLNSAACEQTVKLQWHSLLRTSIRVYYRPQMKFAKVMFLHVSVSHSVQRGRAWPGGHAWQGACMAGWGCAGGMCGGGRACQGGMCGVAGACMVGGGGVRGGGVRSH